MSTDDRPQTRHLLARLGLFVADSFASTVDCRAAYRELIDAEGSAAEVFGPPGAEVAPAKRHAVERTAGPAAATIEAAVVASGPVLSAYFRQPLGPSEPVSFVTYAPGQYYRAHVDRGTANESSQRAVSVVLFLNGVTGDPAETFDGGDLVFYDLLPDAPRKGIGFPLRPAAGLLVAFPSDVLHEVTPVTRGVRAVAVTWFHRGVSTSVGASGSVR